MNAPVYDKQHVAITETEALETFHPKKLKSNRWQARPEGSLLAVLSISKGVLDLCWWNVSSKAWTYISTIKTVHSV